MKNLLKICVLGLLMVSGAALSSDYPTKGINLTVAYGAGGTTDATARVLAQLLEKEFGTSVTVMNKPGGGGSVAAGLAAAQRPDGYNLFTLVTGAAVISPHRQNLPYDTLSDFTFIAQYGAWNAGIVVPADAPYQTFDELVTFAKANPGKISYSIAGVGTVQHLVMERLARAEGLEWTAVPFKGGAAAVTALLGNHVDVMAGAAEWLPQVQSGQFKLLAIYTESRMPQFPDVPTLKELGYNVTGASILGIAAADGVPKKIVAKLDAAIKKATQSKELQDIIDKLSMKIVYRNSADFEQNVRENYDTHGQVIRAAGLGK